jgi:tetratricopeptide (TPR) repeat protein
MDHVSDTALYDYVEGRLSPEERARVLAHVDACADCREVLAQAAAALLTPEDPGSGDTLPGVRQDAAVAVEPGARVDRYVLLQPVGAGGMGVVYAAYDPRLDRKVALKLLRADASGRAGADELRARLLREAQAMARLQHPNVITVHDVGRIGDQVYVAMEFVDGWTLRDWLKAQQRRWREVLPVLLRAGRGLAAAHEVGLVHRDFKPDNVLVGRDGSVRVTDFGLSRATPSGAPTLRSDEPTAEVSPLDTPLTRTGLLVGTPAYMPPEQMRGEATDARADLFSFAVTAFEALWGERPFAGKSLRELRQAIEAGQVREGQGTTGAPARLRRALLPALRARAEARPATLRALLAELEKDPQPRRRLALLVVGVAAAVALWPLAYRRVVERQSLVCKGAERKLAGVWDDARRRDVARAFHATASPSADAAFAAAARALDAYARAWAGEHESACEATRLRGEQSETVLDLRVQCLEQRRQEADALVSLLARADKKLVDKAAEAAGALPPPSACGNVQALRSRPPPPADAARLRQIAALRKTLADVTALKLAGRYRDARKRLEPLLAEARAQQYAPIEASVLVSMGEIESNLGNAKEAVPLLEQAAVAAQRAHDDEIAARAWRRLAFVCTKDLDQVEAGQQWLDLARAATERQGGDAAQEGDELHLAGVIAAQAHRWDEAVADFEQSMALDERAWGRECRQMTPSLSAIGSVRLQQGRVDEALAAFQHAAAILERTLGPAHYRNAYSLQDVANVRFLQLRFADALDGFRRAYDLAAASLGSSADFVATMRSNVGLCQLELGQAQAALASQTEALARYEANGVGHNSFAAVAAGGQGEALLALGRASEALAPFERALERPQAQEPTDLAAAQFGLARALWQLRRERARAETLARAALTAYEKAPPLPYYQRQAGRIRAELARR